jgi:hypothetical protein
MIGQRKEWHPQGTVFFPVLFACLVFIFSFDFFHRESLGNLPAVSPEQSGETGALKIRFVIGTITLEEPRIILHLGKAKEKPERPILELLPSVNRGAISNGFIELDLKDSLQLLIVRKGDFTIRDFTPERGGKASFSGGFNYTVLDKRRTEITGNGSGNLALSAVIPKPVGAGTVNLTIDQGIYGPAVFNQVMGQFPFSVQGDEIKLKAARLTMGTIQVATSQQVVSVKDVRLQGDVDRKSVV